MRAAAATSSKRCWPGARCPAHWIRPPTTIGWPACRGRLPRRCAYGAVRQLGTVRALATRLNARPAGAGIGALQLVGLSELLEPRRRHQAVIVDQLVSAARDEPALAPAAAFLNATMRRFLRERDALFAAIADEPGRAGTILSGGSTRFARITRATGSPCCRPASAVRP